MTVNDDDYAAAADDDDVKSINRSYVTVLDNDHENDDDADNDDLKSIHRSWLLFAMDGINGIDLPSCGSFRGSCC